MPLDPNEIPLTLSELSARLEKLGISGGSVSTLRTMAMCGDLEVNRTGALRSTVKAFLKARGVEPLDKAELEV